ncbi:mRNA-decapping enzyme subunit 2 [Thecaphora frezii]
MPPRLKENVWNYPRPPALQPTVARLRVIWVTPSKQELTIADTMQGYRVLETSHPPTYYFPPSSVRTDLIQRSKARRTMCEWKGLAAYHDLQFSQEQGPIVTARIWSYPEPTPDFAPIRDYLCFYASSKTDPAQLGRWKCMVDDDEVVPQEGDFYGSWITPEIHGGDKGFKGGPAASSSSGSRDPMAAYKGMSFAETLEDLSSRFIVNLPADELASIERICFQVEQGHWFYEDFLRPLNPSLPSLGLRRFSSYLLHTSSIAVPLIQRYITGEGGQQDLEAAFDDFMKYKTRVPVCGAILLAQDWNKCLLVKGWKSSAAWGFPKGKINQDEPERDCAVREVLEETGYDCAALLPPDSEDYLDLTMREQRIRLYIVPGVSDQTHFEAQTRKEISKIAWFKLSDLPTWKKSKEPPPGMGGKFYLISPFIGRLKQWIHNNKYSHPHRPRNLQTPVVEAIAASAVKSYAGYDAATSSPTPAPAKPKAKAPEAVPAFPDSSSLFPSFSSSGGDVTSSAQQKAAPLPAPPTSEKLKALLGLGTTPAPEFESPMPVADGRSPLPTSGLDGVGARMIEASGDPRGRELLDLLRGSGAMPPIAAANGDHHQQQQQQRAAMLLAALNGNQAGQEQAESASYGGMQGLPPSGNKALLELLNSPVPGSPTALRQPPRSTESPLPAPRPQKTIQAQKLLQMISPSSSTFLDHRRHPSQTSLGSTHDSPNLASGEYAQGASGADHALAALMGAHAPGSVQPQGQMAEVKQDSPSPSHLQQQQQQHSTPLPAPAQPGQAQMLLQMLSPGSSAISAHPYTSPQASHHGHGGQQDPLPAHYFANASPSQPQKQHVGHAEVEAARRLPPPHSDVMGSGSPTPFKAPAPMQHDLLAILTARVGPPPHAGPDTAGYGQPPYPHPAHAHSRLPTAALMPYPPPPPPHWSFGVPPYSNGYQ